MIPAWAGLEEAHLQQGHYAGAVGVREQRILATQGETPQAAASIETLHETFDEDDPQSYWRWRQDYNEQRQASGRRVPDVEQAMTATGLGDHECGAGAPGGRRRQSRSGSGRPEKQCRVGSAA